MLNLDKLNSQFDIKSIDFSQITTILTEQKKTVMLACAVLGLLMVFMAYNGYHAKDILVRRHINQAKEKLDVIKARDAAVANFNTFMASTPKEINQFDLMAQISNDASLHHAVISSLKPPETREMGLYSEVDFSFTIVSDSFKDMMVFLRSIETSNPPLRINGWSGQEGADGRITSNIDISSVHIHT